MSTLEKTISILSTMPEPEVETVYNIVLYLNGDRKGENSVQPVHDPDCDCPLCRIYRYPNKETLESFAELENGGGTVYPSTMSTEDILASILAEEDNDA